MKVPCALGVDVGTSSCKVCAVGVDGALLGVTAESYPIRTPRPGWSEQDPRAWLPAMEHGLEALRRLLTPDVEILALALSSAAHIAVLLDARGEPVRDAILWNDQRSVVEAAELVADLGDEILAGTCNQASPTWTLPQLLWVRRHEPDAWDRVARICLSKDYLLWQLTGRFATDPAAAVSSLLYDVIGACWSSLLCDRAGVPRGALPEVLPAAAVAAGLSARVASRLGLPPGLPVIVGTLDSLAESRSAGAVAAGDCVIRLGTGGGVQLLRPGPVGHPKLISYPCSPPPLWLSQAGTNACGAAIDWAAGMLGGLSAAQLSERAAGVPPGADGLFFHPYLLGERCPHWDAALRASFVGLTLAHAPAHLARAVLEGIAYSLRDAASVFAGAEDRAVRMIAVGGGARSAVLTRILCDVFARPVVVDPDADSAHGAALLALEALGHLAPGAAGAVSSGRSALIPEAHAVQQYAEGLVAYRDIHDHLQGHYQARGTWAGGY